MDKNKNIIIKKDVRLCFTVGSKNEYVDLVKGDIISAEELPASSKANFGSFADITEKGTTISIAHKSTTKVQVSKQNTAPEKPKANTASNKGGNKNNQPTPPKDDPKDDNKAGDTNTKNKKSDSNQSKK